MRDISRDLIVRAAGGDMEAFEEIYRSSAGYVYTVAYRITSSREDAEEVTQDVFLKVHANLGSFAFRSSFKTWLFRIATNAAINMYRKRAKDHGRNIPFDDAIEAGEPEERETPDPLEKEENEKLVRSMLGSLPEEQRACVVLRDIEGYKYEEIAEILRININTVRSRLKRAREKLLALYGKGASHEMR